MARLAVISLAALALPSMAPAFVMIDDFTVGEYENTFFGDDNHIERGLDRNHVAFGYRSSQFIQFDTPRVPITIDIGGGKASVGSPEVVFYEWNFRWAGNPNDTIDFSRETEFLVDLFTENPGNLLADRWQLVVLDASGVAANAGFGTRPGGIRFRKRDFTRSVDWSRIQYIEFSSEWSTIPNPLGYTIQRIYAVPEPCTFGAMAAGLGLWLRARRARSHRV